MKSSIFLSLIFAVALSSIDCRKSDFLDKKPNDALVIPTTLSDFQAILDNDRYMNGSLGEGVYPSFGDAGSDDYWVTSLPANITASNAIRNLYIWNDDIYAPMYFEDWSSPYRAIFYSNLVLEGLDRLEFKTMDIPIYNAQKGSALFYRSFMFFGLAQVFCPHYNIGTAKQEAGIVLKKKSDVNEPVFRSTVAETYDQIVADIKEAIPLLPNTVQFKNRPSKPAALALLSRVYLTMQQYDSSLKYATVCLGLYNKLIDYNTLNSNATYPIPQYNEEVLFHCLMVHTTISALFTSSRSRIDSNLYLSYDNYDLRKRIFFANQAVGKSFKGSYSGSLYRFGGLATDEVYLIQAESSIRIGRYLEGIDTLNVLLRKRWDNNNFSKITALNKEDALRYVLQERRKELLFRGLRWTDLRRRNAEGENILLRRVIDGDTLLLKPTDLRYTYLIPLDVMGFNPGMSQNKR